MLLGTFFDRIKTALQSQVCFLCEQKPISGTQRFCRCCQERLGMRPAQAVITTAGFSCYAATTLNPVVKKLLYGYKFYNQTQLAPQLASVLIHYWAGLSLEGQWRTVHPENVLVVPVPPHEGKQSRVDGFAGRFARASGYDYRPDALAWERAVTPQHTIHDKRSRFENIQGSLLCESSLTPDHAKIIIVDDLTTTGATLQEACRAFRQAAPGNAQREIIGLAISKVPLAYQTSSL